MVGTLLDPSEPVEEEVAEWTPSRFPFLQQMLLVAVVDVGWTWMKFLASDEVLVV